MNDDYYNDDLKEEETESLDALIDDELDGEEDEDEENMDFGGFGDEGEDDMDY